MKSALDNLLTVNLIMAVSCTFAFAADNEQLAKPSRIELESVEVSAKA